MILKAYAKINLTLDICGKREDGYHIIDSVFQSVGIFDVIEVKKDNKISVLCEGAQGENNIAFTAAKEFFGFTGIKGGADVKITKNIPMVAGLGGGSADAAAVIIALNKIYGTALTKNQMTEIAVKCGADVPFFLYGGTARVRGIGEIVTPLQFIGDFYALTVKSGDKKSTADMYKKLDNMPALNGVTDEFIKLLSCGEKTAALKKVSNAFLSVYENKNILSVLDYYSPISVSLSGSGPTFFALFCEKDLAQKAEKELKNKGYSPILAPFVSRSVEVVE